MSTRVRFFLPLFLAACLLAACGGETKEPSGGGEGGATPAPEAKGAVLAADQFIAEQSIDKSSPAWKSHLPKPPKFDFDPKDTYTWVLETNQGTMRFKLFPDVAPMHVSSVIYLTRLGFYDGIRFHRVMRDFMAQGGDPLGNGKGGPGYKFAGEFAAAAKHDKAGMLSTANAGPGTDGSQFFVTFGPKPFLDGKYTVFGEIAEGMDVVKRLNSLTSPDKRIETPTEPIVIEKATIEVE